MKRKAIIQAAIVSVCAVVIGVTIGLVRMRCTFGTTSTSGVFLGSLMVQLMRYQKAVIGWAVFVLACMFFTGRLSFSQMTLFSLTTIIGYSLLGSIVSGGQLPGIPEVPFVIADAGHNAYPIFYICAAFAGFKDKKPLIGGLSLLWMAAYAVILPIFAARHYDGLMSSASFVPLYHTILVCAPVFMIIFILYDRFGSKDRIRG